MALAGLALFIARNFNTDPQVTKEAPKKLPPVIPQITVASIFDKPNDLSKLDEGKLITLVATGDVIPARGANWPAVTRNDFKYNWRKTYTYLKDADITLINLEAPLMKSCPLISTGFTFCGKDRHIEGILFAGVDTVSIANNHIDNFALVGRQETIALLEKNKVGWSGFGHLDIQEIKGTKFGFLSYSGIEVPPLDRKVLAAEIKKSKEKVDFLVVSIHWGKEYELLPQKDGNIAPDNPIKIGHLIIDSGADLIIGNHPHWVQGVEIYKNKLITYAHGNFIFDQTWSRETQEGVVGKYTIYENQVVQAYYRPTYVDGSYQPRFVSGTTQGNKIIERMKKSTQLISSSN